MESKLRQRLVLNRTRPSGSAQAQDQATTASNDLISAMGSDMTNEAKGLASIANKTALARVQSQLTPALQSAVQASQSGSSSSQRTGPTNGATATGTGTIPLTAGRSLPTLGSFRTV